MRLYKLCKLSDIIRFRDDQSDILVAIEVEVGRFRERTTFHAAAENVHFNEEIGIPIMWPSVIKQVQSVGS